MYNIKKTSLKNLTFSFFRSTFITFDSVLIRLNVGKPFNEQTCLNNKTVCIKDQTMFYNEQVMVLRVLWYYL